MDLALLRAERMKRGITQEKLAKCLGFKDKSSYCLMEKGKNLNFRRYSKSNRNPSRIIQRDDI